MADSSFDIVSSVDLQEVKNAIAQATKEIQTRYDLKSSHSSVELAGEEMLLTSSDEFKRQRNSSDSRRMRNDARRPERSGTSLTTTSPATPGGVGGTCIARRTSAAVASVSHPPNAARPATEIVHAIAWIGERHRRGGGYTVVVTGVVGRNDGVQDRRQGNCCASAGRSVSRRIQF